MKPVIISPGNRLNFLAQFPGDFLVLGDFEAYFFHVDRDSIRYS